MNGINNNRLSDITSLCDYVDLIYNHSIDARDVPADVKWKETARLI
jgi:hypothetical protein